MAAGDRGRAADRLTACARGMASPCATWHARHVLFLASQSPRRRQLLEQLGLGAEKEYARPGHWALTDSRPSADVTLIILRVADLAAALLTAFLSILNLF